MIKNKWTSRCALFLVSIFTFLVVATSARAQVQAPDYTGDLWSCPRLTSDWGDLRTKLADNGVTLDLDFVSIPQGVVGGGKDTTWKWGLNLTVWILRIEGSS